MQTLLEMLKQKLGDYKQEGKWSEFRCIFCDDLSTHMGVNFEWRVVHCLRCGRSIHLADLLTGLGLRGGSLLKTVPLRRAIDVPKQQAEPISINEWQDLSDSKTDSLLAEKARAYLKKRGVDLDLYHVGISEKLLGRAIFLIVMKNRPVYYTARSIYPARRKILNPPVTDGYGWSSPDDVIFNYDLMKRGNVVVIGEGVFDAVSCTDEIRNIIGTCLLGTREDISKTQSLYLWQKRPKHIVVFLDKEMDDVAVQLARNISKRGFDTKLVLWHRWDDKKKVEANDPAELSKEKRFKMIEGAIDV